MTDPRELLQILWNHFYQQNDVKMMLAEDELAAIQKTATELIDAYSARITLAAVRDLAV
jgi:hypothetical protein